MKVKCPVCREEIDTSKTKETLRHIKKDEAHRIHLEKVKARKMIEDITSQTGLIRTF